jgi:hypothetical protein
MRCEEDRWSDIATHGGLVSANIDAWRTLFGAIANIGGFFALQCRILRTCIQLSAEDAADSTLM